jgi:hypothetical protein
VGPRKTMESEPLSRLLPVHKCMFCWRDSRWIGCQWRGLPCHFAECGGCAGWAGHENRKARMTVRSGISRSCQRHDGRRESGRLEPGKEGEVVSDG